MGKIFKLTEDQVASLPGLRARGLTYASIGKILSVSVATVHRYFGLFRRDCTYYYELCKEPRRSWLHYHHWDDENPEYGLWLCPRCHRFAEVADSFSGQDVMNRYINLRQKAIQEVDSRPPRKLLDVSKKAAGNGT